MSDFAPPPPTGDPVLDDPAWVANYASSDRAGRRALLDARRAEINCRCYDGLTSRARTTRLLIWLKAQLALNV
jgi:hypothetical protein